MKLTQKDLNNVINRYTKRFLEFGHDPKSLGWDKGKQFLRYHILIENLNLENSTILDLGCGFGDANYLLKQIVSNYSYLGIDIVPVLINEANKIWEEDLKINFINDDFLSFDFSDNFDYVISSGMFNFKLNDIDNYIFIENTLKKAFKIAKKAVSFDFLSNNVDYEYKHTFHSNPSKILEIAYSLTKRVRLRNDYMPFEFSITLFKDDTFDSSDTVFKNYKIENPFVKIS